MDLGTTTPKKCGLGRPLNIRVVQPAPAIPVVEPDVAEDINETFPTLFPVRKCLRRRQAMPQAQPVIVQPDAPLPFIEDQTAIKQIHICNLQDNIDLTRHTSPAGPNQHDTIPMVIEDHQPVKMDRHFPRLHPLTSTFIKDVQLKTCRDVLHQKVIDKIIDQMNSTTIHFYNLPFALDILRKVGQVRSSIILILWNRSAWT